MEERIHCCRVHWGDAEDGERENEREREHVERDVTVRPRRDAGGQTDRRPVVVWCEQSDREGTPRSFCYSIYYHVRGCILTPSFRWVWIKPLSIRVNNNRNVRPCVFVWVINSIFYSTAFYSILNINWSFGGGVGGKVYLIILMLILSPSWTFYDF